MVHSLVFSLFPFCARPVPVLQYPLPGRSSASISQAAPSTSTASRQKLDLQNLKGGSNSKRRHSVAISPPTAFAGQFALYRCIAIDIHTVIHCHNHSLRACDLYRSTISRGRKGGREREKERKREGETHIHTGTALLGKQVNWDAFCLSILSIPSCSGLPHTTQCFIFIRPWTNTAK